MAESDTLILRLLWQKKWIYKLNIWVSFIPFGTPAEAVFFPMWMSHEAPSKPVSVPCPSNCSSQQLSLPLSSIEALRTPGFIILLNFHVGNDTHFSSWPFIN